MALHPLLLLMLSSVLPTVGCALYTASPAGDATSASSRLLRSEDSGSELHADEIAPVGSQFETKVINIEMDSSGHGRLNAGQNAAALIELEEPHLLNGGFDETNAPENYVWQKEVPNWMVFGPQGADSQVALVASGSAAFGGVQAVDGTNLIGLRGTGIGISQEVGGHTKSSWYTLLWHASCHSQSEATQAKLKVSVSGSAKFDEEVECGGAMKWYKVSYQSFGDYGHEMIRFEIPAGGSQEDAVILDKIVITPETAWDFMAKGPVTVGGSVSGGASVSGGQVLIQKVVCNGPASKESCSRGKFLTCGGFDEDGITDIVETSAAGECSVFQARQNSVKSAKWQFKCNCIQEAASSGEGEVAPGGGLTTPGGVADDAWWLHSGYGPNTCQAKNGDPGFDKNFDVRENLLGSLQLTTTGVSCGSLFAIMKHT